MITFNEGNTLEIRNNRGTLSIEDDIQDGMSFVISNDAIAIKIVALVKNEQLEKLLNHEFKSQLKERVHFVIKLKLQTKRIGVKKALEITFSDVNILDEKKKDYKIIFSTEDTTYVYPLEEDEWNEIFTLIRWIV